MPTGRAAQRVLGREGGQPGPKHPEEGTEPTLTARPKHKEAGAAVEAAAPAAQRQCAGPSASLLHAPLCQRPPPPCARH